MSSYEYTQSLPDSFDSARIRESLANSAKMIGCLVSSHEHVRMMYHGGDKFFPKEIQAVNTRLVQYCKNNKFNGRPVTTVEQVFDGILTTLGQLVPWMQRELNSKFNREVGSEGLTYDKVYFLQTVELVDFSVNYINRYFDVVTALAYNDYAKRPRFDGLGPNDFSKLQEQAIDFAIICRSYVRPVGEVEKLMNAVPDMLVSEDESGIAAIVGRSNIDPMGFVALPWPMSLIFNVRMYITDIALNLYELNVETEKVVERRILALKHRLETGEGDAVLERALEIQEGRLQKIKRRIEKAEQRYGK